MPVYCPIIVPNWRKTRNSHIFLWKDPYTTYPPCYEGIKFYRNLSYSKFEDRILLIKDEKCKRNPFY